MDFKRFTFNLDADNKELLDIIAKRKLYGSTSELVRELIEKCVKENEEVIRKAEEENK